METVTRRKPRRPEITADFMVQVATRIQAGATYLEVADELDVSTTTIQQICKDLDVRPISAAERARRKREAAIAEAKQLLADQNPVAARRYEGEASKRAKRSR